MLDAAKREKELAKRVAYHYQILERRRFHDTIGYQQLEQLGNDYAAFSKKTEGAFLVIDRGLRAIAAALRGPILIERLSTDADLEAAKNNVKATQTGKFSTGKKSLREVLPNYKQGVLGKEKETRHLFLK